MSVVDFVSQNGVFCRLHARCKRDALKLLSTRAAALTGVSAEQIFDALLERERLGSTGVGRGIALPHGKIEGVATVIGLLASFDHPFDFESVDSQPVDLVFVLLAPTSASAAHLKALAKASRLFRSDELREALRSAETAEAMYAVLNAEAQPHAA